MPQRPSFLQDRSRWQPWLAVLAVAATVSCAIVHSSVNQLSERNLGGLTDTMRYVRMYYGEETSGHWRYRVLTVGLARLVPDTVERFLQRERTPFRRAHIHFAFVNLAFLIGTGLLFFAYLRAFFEEAWVSLLGVVLYLASRVNVQAGGAPMVDPGAFFFLLLGAHAIVRRSWFALFAALTFGVFTKETSLLLWPMLWLADCSWGQKTCASLALLPGTIAYLTFRFVLSPDPGGHDFFSVGRAPLLLHQLATFVRPNGLVDWISSFGLLWIPSVYAMVRCPRPPILQRWLWLLPIVLATILLLGGNLGRILFLTFPVVIPFALLGIREWLQPVAAPE